jgi:hypothetical protein
VPFTGGARDLPKTLKLKYNTSEIFDEILKKSIKMPQAMIAGTTIFMPDSTLLGLTWVASEWQILNGLLISWCALVGAVGLIVTEIRRALSGPFEASVIFWSLCAIALIARNDGARILSDAAKFCSWLSTVFNFFARKLFRSSNELKSLVEQDEIKIPRYVSISGNDFCDDEIKDSSFARPKSPSVEKTTVKWVYVGLAFALVMAVAFGRSTREPIEITKLNGTAYSGPFAPRFSPEPDGLHRGIGGPAEQEAEAFEADPATPEISQPADVIPLPRARPFKKRREMRDPWIFPQVR